MKQSGKLFLFLLVLLFGLYCIKNQCKESTEPKSVEDSITLLDEIDHQNDISTLHTKKPDSITCRSTVSIADYPFVATLIITDTWNIVYYRTGAIISDTHVLTAAISVPEFDPPTSSVSEVQNLKQLEQQLIPIHRPLLCSSDYNPCW